MHVSIESDFTVTIQSGDKAARQVAQNACFWQH